MMPDLTPLIHWLERALPLEGRATVPEALIRIADVFASRGANLGLQAEHGVTIDDAITLAGFRSYRLTTALAEVVAGALRDAVSGDEQAMLRMPTEEVVAVLRASAADHCSAQGRPLGATEP
jgi:hypothetical protein